MSTCHPWATLGRLLAIFNNICQLLTTFNKFWQLLTTSDSFWQLLLMFAIFCNLFQILPTWLSICHPVWSAWQLYNLSDYQFVSLELASFFNNVFSTPEWKIASLWYHPLWKKDQTSIWLKWASISYDGVSHKFDNKLPLSKKRGEAKNAFKFSKLTFWNFPHTY